MNLITQCFEESYTEITQKLYNANYTIEEINKFLPAALAGITISSAKTSIYQTFAGLASNKPTETLKVIDIFSISRETGINVINVAIGLRSIAPILVKAFAENSVYHKQATLYMLKNDAGKQHV